MAIACKVGGTKAAQEVAAPSCELTVPREARSGTELSQGSEGSGGSLAGSVLKFPPVKSNWTPPPAHLVPCRCLATTLSLTQLILLS